MKILLVLLSLAALVAGLALGSWKSPDSVDSHASRLERGAYLVRTLACADCHTPLRMGPNGPEPDAERAFSGHPAEAVLPPAPALPPGPWNVVVSETVTAWAGPWGTSFTANITPDEETGIGSWTEEQFVAAIRNGRHRGHGRKLLPPMPAKFYANLTDEDLKAVFAHLRTLPAVSNRVPEPLPPAMGS